MSPLRFFTVFLGTWLAFGAAVFAFNVAVDPYLLFNLPRLPGFNASKPAVKTRERLIKAYAAPRNSPRTLILGSSRCDIGVDPASSVWRASDRPVYNLSIPGGDLAQLTLLFRHVLALSSPADTPRTAIVCLDFEFFLFRREEGAAQSAAALGLPVQDEFEERLAVLENGQPNRMRGWRMAKDYANAVFSMAAMADSVLTVAANALPESWDITPDGHLAESMFRRPIAADGTADLFAVEDIDIIHRYSTRQVLSAGSGGRIDRLPAVRNLIEIARRHGMTIIFAIQPSHADFYELFDQMGYWDDYEAWKRALTRLVAAERRRGSAVALWDFGGYEAFSVERVPGSDDRSSRLKWFWDTVHYTTALGDIMVARMLGRPSSAAYGVELTPESLDTRLARIRRDREVYRARELGEAQRRSALFAGNNSVGRAAAELWHRDAAILQLASLWESAME